MTNSSLKEVQHKILEIMEFIDRLCRENGITYYIMGGTAIGAVRHGGFIPWDDDLDIFMTPNNYIMFKRVFEGHVQEQFILQEWRTNEKFLEYAKVRMNGTTFIEKNFSGDKTIHQGIYVDIMILHKCSNNRLIQRGVYLVSKYVTLLGLSQRNWIPKNLRQSIALKFLKVLPNKFLSSISYRIINKYDALQTDFVYCYFITKAFFKQGIFPPHIFSESVDIPFERMHLMGSKDILLYLEIRYGEYMKLPSESERNEQVHALIADVDNGYELYLDEAING